jgi:hypothetical protein
MLANGGTKGELGNSLAIQAGAENGRRVYMASFEERSQKRGRGRPKRASSDRGLLPSTLSFEYAFDQLSGLHAPLRTLRSRRGKPERRRCGDFSFAAHHSGVARGFPRLQMQLFNACIDAR